MQFDFESLSNLARLGINQHQQATLSKDLKEILGFVKVLEQVRISKSADLESVSDLVNQTQPDLAQNPWPADIAQTLLGQAPSTKKGYLVIEKVIER